MASKKILRKRDRVVSGSKTFGLGPERASSGFGHIIIPSDVERDDYIVNCNRTGTVMMVVSPYNDVVKGVRVTKNVLKEIVFPDSPGEYGDLVAWINSPNINQITILGILMPPSEQNVYTEGTRERMFSTGNTSVNEVISTKDSSVYYSLSLKNADSNNGEMAFTASSESGVSNVTLGLDGQLYLNSDAKTNVKSFESVNIEVGTDRTENKSNLKIDVSGNLEYLDYNGNYIKVEPEKITLESPNGEIILGEGATEASVLGNKLQDELNKSKTRIDSIIQAISSAPVTPGDGGTSFKASLIASLSALISENYGSILSTKNKVE